MTANEPQSVKDANGNWVTVYLEDVQHLFRTDLGPGSLGLDGSGLVARSWDGEHRMHIAFSDEVGGVVRWLADAFKDLLEMEGVSVTVDRPCVGEE